MPDLGIDHILAKVDTGAKTCALHAFYIEPFDKDGTPWIRFGLHPKQDNSEEVLECEAAVHDIREVSDSGGHKEARYVIKTRLHVANRIFKAEVTLTNRDSMKYRVLLGRNALRRRFVVDPQKSFLLDRHTPEED